MDYFKEDYDKFRTFICYRHKNGKGREMYGASQDVAGLIWWWINNSEYLDYKPALFQQCYHDEKLEYDREAIEKVMPNVKKFFLIICQNFFKEILDRFDEIRKDSSFDEAVKCVKLEIEANPNKNIYYFEIKSALEHVEKCNIHAIFVSVFENGDVGFGSPEHESALFLLFGDKFREVVHRVNTYKMQYLCIGSKTYGFNWEASDNEKINKLVTELEEDVPEVKQLKLYVSNTLKPKIEHIIPLEQRIRVMKNDLKKCASTIIDMQLPKVDSVHKGMILGKQPYFRASNNDIIYDPVRIRHTSSPPPFLAQCLIDSFCDHQKEFELASDHFGFWNVDLQQSELKREAFDGISVCAVCFGCLIIQHRLKRDGSVLNEGVEEEVKKVFVEKMNAGLNLLIALRNPYTKTWPSLWVFDNKTVDIEGTVNQTTLSLSTLLSCGFLSIHHNSEISSEALMQRTDFIWESVQCLFNGCRVQHDYAHRKIEGWGYKIDLKDSDMTTLAFTVFVFDTLLKFKSCLLELKCYFEPINKTYSDKIAERVNMTSGHLESIIYYFNSEQDDEKGFFSRTSDKSDEGGSVTHTAYVIKSLYGYITKESNVSDIVRKILDEAVKYFLNRIEYMKEKDSFDFSYGEMFEIDEDKTRAVHEDGIEQYEHCSELIIAETLVKIVEHNFNVKDIGNRALSCLEWLLGKYLNNDSKMVARRGNNVFVNGKQDGLKFPIFYLYYYRMVLLDCLTLFEKRE